MLQLNLRLYNGARRAVTPLTTSPTWRRYQANQKTAETNPGISKTVSPPPSTPPSDRRPSSIPATPTPLKTLKMAMPVPPTIQISDTKAVVDVARQQEEKLRLATSFDEMPGPPMLKFLARAWSYLPRISNQFTAGAMMYFMNMLGRIDDRSRVGTTLVWNRGTTPFVHMFEKYGPVVRLQGIFGGDIVFVGRPDHIETVFRQEGKYPLRSSLDSLEKYRVQHRRESIGGLFITSGFEWESLRSKLEIPLNQSVSQYAASLEIIADEFVAHLKTLLNRQDEVPATFSQEIFKWSLECVALVCLGKRMGCLGPDKATAGSEGLALLQAMTEASAALRRCESGFQLWRLIETPNWKMLRSSCEKIDGIILKHIRKIEARVQVEKLVTEEELKTTASSLKELRGQTPLLESLLAGGGLRPEDALTVILDALLVGTNACAHALAFLLYHLARSPRAQRSLFLELEAATPGMSGSSGAMPSDVETLLEASVSGSVDEEIHEEIPLYHLPYLRACLRESLRLNPPIPVLTRVLPTDIALHNYRVPKGTLVLMASHVAGQREENFEDAKKFKPERWLQIDRDVHPFATVPFGHGPRSCIAQHLAEMQICLLTAKIIRNFKVEYNYGTMHPTSKLIAMPNKPLKFRFMERS